MPQHLQEYANSHAVDLRVDRELGVIRGVKIIGLASRNGRRYLPAALAEAVALYEGAKVNVNHPKGSPLAPRDYQDRIGVIRNVHMRASEGLFGDLHFNPRHVLAEQLVWDAEHAPENVGFSHNVTAHVVRSGDETVVESIVKVQSVDLVADPAATRGLFEAVDATIAEVTDERPAAPRDASEVTWSELTLEQLRAKRPDLVDEIARPTVERVQALEAELAERRAAEIRHQRRERIRELLEEYRLPTLESSNAAARTIVSAEFLDALYAAPDDAALRALVERRVDLVRSARMFTSAGVAEQRPVAREQSQVEPHAHVVGAKAFVQAITEGALQRARR